MVGAGYTSRQEGQERHPRDGGSFGVHGSIANFVIVMSGRCGGDGQPREGMKEGCCKVLVWSLEIGQRAKVILFLVLFLMGMLMKRLWGGGVGVAGEVGGGGSRVAGVVGGFEVGGGALEVRLVVIPRGGSRSRDMLRAGDLAWGGLDECVL